MASQLTEEQQRRIEENRQKALLKRAQKTGKVVPSSNVSSSNDITYRNKIPSVNVSGSKSHHTSQSKPQISITKKGESSDYLAVHPQTLMQRETSIVDRSKSIVTTYASSSPSVCTSSDLFTKPSSTIDFDKIEQNRLKALAKRAEKLNKSPGKGTSSSLQSAPSIPFSYHTVSGSLKTSSSSGLPNCINTTGASTNILTKPELSVDKPQTSGSTLAPGVSDSATSGQWNLFSGGGHNKVKGGCVLVSRDRFSVNVGYSAPLVQLFKSMETKLYDAVSKSWSFRLTEYNKFMSAVKSLGPSVELEPLPKAVLQVFSGQLKGDNPVRHIPIADLSRVEPSLVNSLMSFQREGVNYGVYKNGRVLIADDMGLGKTIQAICLACYYRDEWPLLIVVPSSVRFDWAQNMQRWVPSLDPQSIQVAVTGKDNCTSGLVNILSYDLMAKKADVLQKKCFNVVIMDECHLLKNFKTARCKAAMPILKGARRVILLSGTPALSRPSELYTQICAVCPFLFKYHEFGVRYCDGKQHQWGWDFSGSSNMAELQILLEEKIMIRRLKKDVIKELPDKVRQMVLLDPNCIKIDKSLKNASKVMNITKLKNTEQRGALLDFFHKSGTAKMKAIKNYVEDLLEEEKKFLIFAHHGEVMDGIEMVIKNKISNNYIRIDGRTNSEARNIYCQKFQHSDSVRAAILSITAANAGLNLSAANLVVFAELFWNPGILTQAEDRAHRIGQVDMVVVQYLVAKGTSDDHIWPMIQQKLDVLGKAGLSKDNFSAAETTQQLDPKQEEITRFLEESFSDDFPQIPDVEAETDEKEQAQEFVKSDHLSVKGKKQASILQYTSPVKDLPPTICTTPTKDAKPRGLFKYFSPNKQSKTESNNNNISETDLKDSKGHTLTTNPKLENNLEDWFDDVDDDWCDNDNDTEPRNKKRKVQNFQPPFKS